MAWDGAYHAVGSRYIANILLENGTGIILCTCGNLYLLRTLSRLIRRLRQVLEVAPWVGRPILVDQPAVVFACYPKLRLGQRSVATDET